MTSVIFSSFISCADLARAEGQVIASKGGEVFLSNVTVETVEDYKSAVISRDAGSGATLSDVTVDTKGVNAAGLEVADGGLIEVTRGTINTQDGVAVLATAGGILNIDGTQINSSAAGKPLISITGNGTQFNGRDLVLTGIGSGASGISVSDSAATSMNNIAIDLQDASNGIMVSGGDLTITGLKLKQTSTGSQNAVYAQGDLNKISSITLNKAEVEATGEHDVLVNANNHSAVTLNEGTYRTSGDYFTALSVASTNGKLEASDITVTTDGNTSHAAYNRSVMSISNSSLTTQGNGAYALYSEGALTANNVTLATHGSGAAAIAAAKGGSLTLNRGEVETTAASGYGAINYVGSRISATNLALNTHGEGAHALLVYSGSHSTFTDSTLAAKGNNSAALYVMGAYPDNPETVVNLQGTHLSSQHNQGLYASGAKLTVNLDKGATFSGGNGQLATVGSGMSGTNVVDSEVLLNANDGSTLTGDILTDGGNSTVDVNLSQASAWTGATQSARNLGIDDSSRWEMTTSSRLSNLRTDGVVNFRKQNNGYSTLTIKNDLTGNGEFNINTYLGDSSSPTDKIDVKGSAKGDFRLTVNNSGGNGALTDGDGIEVVNIDGDAQGRFTLTRRVAAGAYEYQLAQGGSRDQNNWYLRSSYLTPAPAPDPEPNPEPNPGPDPDPNPGPNPGPDPDPNPGPNPGPDPDPNPGPNPGPDPDPNPGPNPGPDPDPNPGPNPGPDPDPNPGPNPGPDPDSNSDPKPNPDPAPAPSGDVTPWRSEVPGYAIAPWLLQRYAFDALGTYHQRMGGDVNRKNGTWARITTQHLDAESDRFGYDADYWYAQFGGDLWEVNGSESRQQAGWIVTIGNTQAEVSDSARSVNPALSTNTGNVDAMAYGAGGYYTLVKTDGGYLDIVSQATWYHTNFESVETTTQHGYSAALSVEIGQPFHLVDHLHIEPQLQVKTSYIHLKDFNDGISHVSATSGVQGQVRTGLRMYVTEPTLAPYATVDMINDIGNELSVSVAGKSVRPEFSGDYWQAGAGISSAINKDSAVYFETHYLRSFSGSQDGYSGNVGIKMTF